MADYQRVVEYLRDVRSMQNPPVTDELRQHAQEFADLCTQVNERLRKCSGFLQQGLRSEAIHLAEESPNLLDLVAALDLPDPQVWVEFCQATEMAVPPPLQLDRATQLNEAYAIDQPLEHLLGQHRLLALQRAPVGRRLTVMRQLAAQDPASTFWEKDIRQFEKVRLRELPGEFHEALKRRDDAAVGALGEEIEGQPWYEAVPEDLRGAVGEALARIHRTQLEKELRRQLDRMHEAFAARSVEQAGPLLARWNETIKAAGAPNISKEIVEQVAPIAAWIEQEHQAQQRIKAYNSAVATFTQLLDQDASDAELDGALDRVKAFDEQPVPENLVERLQAMRVRRAAEAKGKQKLRLMMLATAAVVVLLIAGGALFLVMRNQGAAGLARTINTAVAGKQVEQVRRVLKEAEGSPYASDAAVATARQGALNFIHAFEDRKEKVAGAIKLLGDLKAKYEAAVKDPAETPGDLLVKAQTLDDQMGALPGDEVRDADAGGVMQSLKGEVGGIRTALRARASGMVRDQLTALQQRLDAVVAAGTMTPEQAGELARIEGEAARLRDLAGLDDGTKGMATELADAVTKQRESTAEGQAIARDLVGLVQRTASVDDYKSALNDFVAAHPTAPEAGDFKKAAENLAALKPLDTWREQLAAFGGADQLMPKNADTAAKRIEVLTAFIAANPASPLLVQLNGYLEYLKAASAALGDTDSLQKKFEGLLQNPVITSLYYLEDNKGTKYFVLEEMPKVTVSGLGGRPTYHFEQIDPNNPVRKKGVDIESPLRIINKDFRATPAAHKSLATEVDTKLRAIDETNWDTAGFELIDLIASAEVDPLVKVTMLQAAITGVKAADGALIGDAYDKTLAGLGKLGLDGITMPLLSGKPLSVPVQTQMDNILKAMPSGKSVQQAYLAARGKMFGALAIESATTGLLLKKGGVETVVSRTEASNGMVARTAGAGGMVDVAKYVDGKWVMGAAANDMPEGTLVLIGK